MPVPTTRPLIVTADGALLDDLLRLAAAAGADADVRASPPERTAWDAAPVVVVGGDLAEAVVRARLPRRADVVLVTADLDDAQVWRQAVDLGAAQVGFVPDAEPWLTELFADAAEGRPAHGPVVAVVGGRGGGGATTLAVALALTSVRSGRRTMLVDADPYGGGIDLVLGGEAADGLRWPDLTGTRGRVSSPSLYDALPRLHALTVLSWDRSDALTVPPAAMAALLPAAERGSQLVVVDLPRHLDEAARLVLDRARVALVVVPAEVRAAAAAARVAAAASVHCTDLRVVVRGPAPSGLSAQTVAAALGLPLAGNLRAEPGLAAALERGEPPARTGRGPLADFCSGLLTAIPGSGGVAA